MVVILYLMENYLISLERVLLKNNLKIIIYRAELYQRLVQSIYVMCTALLR